MLTLVLQFRFCKIFLATPPYQLLFDPGLQVEDLHAPQTLILILIKLSQNPLMGRMNHYSS